MIKRSVNFFERFYRNQQFGYALFDRPLLISYSRSGTNWIRYFIEATTGQRTPGQRRLVGEGDYFIDRAHAGFARINKYNKVLLIIRNYKECITRHHGIENIRNEYPNMTKFLKDNRVSQPASWYYKNIKAFDRYNKQKLVIYYEELLLDPTKHLWRIAEFLTIEKLAFDEFVKNLDYHKTNSVDAYTSRGHKSETRGESSKVDFHGSKLTNEEIYELDSYFREKDIDLFEKYLKRYEADWT